MSPRKVRLIADLVGGMGVAEADAQLRYVTKAASRPVRTLLASAVANAEHTFGLKRSNLVIRTICVNQGATVQRFQSRAFGRAAPIRKRTSHVTIVLDERIPTTASAKRVPPSASSAPVIVADRRTALRTIANDGATGEGPTGKQGRPHDERHGPSAGPARGGRRGFLGRFFNRRSGER